jgi:thiosulfate dehydrogenase
MCISRGGQLYDNWWRTKTDAVKPDDDHPLWDKQGNNKLKGYETYRCKECHGWDYKGKDGIYGNGSHYTGFKGVYETSNMYPQDIKAILKGSVNKEHDFSKYLSDEDIMDIVLFLRWGMIDMETIVTKDRKVMSGSKYDGKALFNNNCTISCHGNSGMAINLGEPDAPRYVATIAKDEPWEFIHIVRAGHPGTRMPSAIINKWSKNDINSILAFAMTLPDKETERSIKALETRGFGPVKK